MTLSQSPPTLRIGTQYGHAKPSKENK